MSAAQLIAEVATFGGVLSVNGDRLRIASDVPLPDDLLSRLRIAKQSLIDAIRRASIWDEGDWRDFYEERAAIAEFEGRMCRADAEASAMQHCVVKWLALNPPTDLGENVCCACGTFAGADALVILAGDGKLRRIVHARCHTPLLDARRAEALAAINAALRQPITPPVCAPAHAPDKRLPT